MRPLEKALKIHKDIQTLAIVALFASIGLATGGALQAMLLGTDPFTWLMLSLAFLVVAGMAGLTQWWVRRKILKVLGELENFIKRKGN